MFFSFLNPVSLTLGPAVGRLTNVTLVGVAVFFGSAGAQAESGDATVRVQCTRLDRAQAEELAARVHLLFAERGVEPSGIELRCTSSRAWIVWGDEQREVQVRGQLPDAFLDAVDARLALAYREVPGEESASIEGSVPGSIAASTVDDAVTFSVPPPTPAETPRFDRPPRVEPASRRWPEHYRPEGGLSLGVDLDSSHGDLDASWGPRLEVGVPVGLFTALVAEEARFGSRNERRTMNLGAELGVGFGAPYARGVPFGVALRASSDWLIGYTRDSTIAHTYWTPGVALGLRAALDAPLVPWIGIDGRLRLQQLELGNADSEPLPRLTATVTIGLAYLADGQNPFRSAQKARALVAQGSPSLSMGPEGTEPTQMP
jgi:hypothetical protein